MPTKEIVCLAYSRKMGGSCFAGIDVNTRQWIRAIGSHQNGALADNDCFMRDDVGRYILPGILDVIQIDFLGAQPIPIQPENWKIAASEWRRVRQAGAADFDQIKRHITDDSELFRGYERYVTKQEIEARPPKSSLALVRPTSLCWNPITDRYRRRGYRGNFTVSGATYDLPLTDDRYAAKLARGPVDQPAAPLLTISLGDLYEETGRYYKLIAGVVELA
jgi:hypothetical protein